MAVECVGLQRECLWPGCKLSVRYPRKRCEEHAFAAAKDQRDKARKKWLAKPENYKKALAISAECNRRHHSERRKGGHGSGGGLGKAIAIHNDAGECVGSIRFVKSVVFRETNCSVEGKRPGVVRESVDTFACFDLQGNLLGEGEPMRLHGESPMESESCRQFFTRITKIETSARGRAA